MPTLLAPFAAGRDGRWDRRAAAHLLRRSGFGAPPSEIDRALSTGLERTVAALFDDAADQEAEFQALFDRVRALLDFSDIGELQAWWCHRMLSTGTPLREKLTLFWHGHFATSFAKVGVTDLMHQQVEMLRAKGGTRFPDLTLAVARDPAMLVYLDGESNTKEHPNENFARELMELFTCGIGEYTESDVKEAARAFTGWHRNGSDFSFNAEAHDDGVKKFLGRRGSFDGGDVVTFLMEHPTTARTLARKLLRFFAAPDPAASVVDESTAVLMQSGYDIRGFLSTLFRSRYFYSAECYRTRIASPTELVVGTVRTLGASFPPKRARDHISAMGQDLYMPPNVKGWDGEDRWINSSWMAARLSFAQQIADLRPNGAFDPDLKLAEVVPPDMTDPSRVIDLLDRRLFHGDLSKDVRRELADFLVTGDQGRDRKRYEEDAGFREDQTRRTLGLTLSLPEYYQC